MKLRGNCADRCSWLTSLALLSLFGFTASGGPVETNRNPDFAKQTQATLDIPQAPAKLMLGNNAAHAAIEHLLGPQITRLKNTQSAAPILEGSQFYPEGGDAPSFGSPDFRSVHTWNATPSKNPSDVRAIAGGDFDRQKGPDVATMQQDGTLNILYNRGNGNFTSSYVNRSAVVFNAYITSIEVADLNGDRYPDIVALDASNSSLLIFLNNRDGTFANAARLDVAPTSGATFKDGGAFAISDVNGDGVLDIVTVSTLQNVQQCCSTVFSQQTFLGNGNGSFQLRSERDSVLPGFLSIPYGDTLRLADLNGDKRLDLVLETVQFQPTAAVSVRVSLGSEDGSFQNIPAQGATVANADAGRLAGGLAIADLNHDGHPDVVFTTSDSKIYVALATGTGSLNNPVPVLKDIWTAALLTAADLNMDGKPDLIVAAMGQIGVFTGRGDGTFAPAATGQYQGGTGSYQLPAAADFNGDGFLDVVTLDSSNNQVALYLGNGHGRLLAAGVIYPARNRQVTSPSRTEWAANVEVAAVGDFLNLGRTQVLAYDPLNPYLGLDPALDIGTSDASGHFFFQEAMSASTLKSLASEYQGVSIAPVTADFNRDGRADLILQTFAGLAVSTMSADGIFGSPVPVHFPVPIYCAPIQFLDVGDVNGDGFPDIVAAYARNVNCPPSASTPSGFFVLLGDGKGLFHVRFHPFGNAIAFLKLADLNGDGKLDLILSNVYDASHGLSDIYVLRGDGHGAFNITNSGHPVITGEMISGVVTGDYNGDGKQDLTILTAGKVARDGSPIPGTQGVRVLPGKGDFTFGDSTLLLPGIVSMSGKYSDSRRSGQPDLSVAVYYNMQKPKSNFGVVVLPNRGGGRFGSAVNLLLPYEALAPNTEVFVGNFTGDRGSDIVAGLGTSSVLFLNSAEREGEEEEIEPHGSK